MAVEIQIPSVGESVSEVELGEWLKKEGDTVAQDEILVMLESDKATVELPSPSAGVLGRIVKKTGDSAQIGETIAFIEAAGSAPAPAPSNGASLHTQETGESPVKATPEPGANGYATGTEPPRLREGLTPDAPPQSPSENQATQRFVMPAAERVAAQNGLDATTIEGTGPGGAFLKKTRRAPSKRKAPRPLRFPQSKAPRLPPSKSRRPPRVRHSKKCSA